MELLLHSQHVLDLKMNSDYSPSKMKDFVNKKIKEIEEEFNKNINLMDQ